MQGRNGVRNIPMWLMRGPLWVQWILASVGIPVLLLPMVLWNGIVWLWFVMGPGLGLGQWLLLRPRLPHLIPESIILWMGSAAVLGFIVGSYFIGNDAADNVNVQVNASQIGVVIGAGVSGLVYGLVQWSALRKHIRHAILWMPLSVGGYVVGWWGSVTIARVLTQGTDTASWLTIVGGLVGTALVTGVGLEWLVSRDYSGPLDPNATRG